MLFKVILGETRRLDSSCYWRQHRQLVEMMVIITITMLLLMVVMKEKMRLVINLEVMCSSNQSLKKRDPNTCVPFLKALQAIYYQEEKSSYDPLRKGPTS